MVTFETTTGVLRAGKHHEKYGDEYDWSATVVCHNKIATVVGATGTLPPRVELRNVLPDAGFTTARWERIVDGVVTFITVDLERRKDD